MKREVQCSNRTAFRICVLLSVIGAALLALVVGQALFPQMSLAFTGTFTGEVDNDFTDPTVDRILSDPDGDVGQVVDCILAGFTRSGWDFTELAVHYDCDNDTLYVGINYPSGRIAGDAEGDGDPSNTHACLAGVLGQDLAGLGGTESIALGFDLNQDGSYDWIAGIDSTSGCNGQVARYTCGSTWAGCPPSSGFGAAPTLGAAYSLYACPTDGPPAVEDFEFSITSFSTLYTELGYPVPNCRTTGNDYWDWEFDYAVFAGSLSDDGVGEDLMIGTMGFGPNAVVVSDLDTRPPVYQWVALAAGTISLVGLGGALLLLRRKRVL